MAEQYLLDVANAENRRLEIESRKLKDALRLIVKKSLVLLTNPNCRDISSIAENALK